MEDGYPGGHRTARPRVTYLGLTRYYDEFQELPDRGMSEGAAWIACWARWCPKPACASCVSPKLRNTGT